MTARTPRWARTRALTLAGLSALAVLAACEARMPTAAEVDALDARGATRAVATGGGEVVYKVDGRARPIDANVRRWIVEVSRVPTVPAVPPDLELANRPEFQSLIAGIICSIRARVGASQIFRYSHIAWTNEQY